MELDSTRRGLVLKEDFPQLMLKKGHRLIENESVRDIHAFVDIELPAWLDFFDTSSNSQINVITPLFSIP
eukprot:8994915-Pyramimonas_sp.AAC.1